MAGGNRPSKSKTPKSTNQGVDANLPSDSDATDMSCSCSITTPTQLGSLTHVREELQTVLDLMGNSTPRLTNVNTTSSDADNEESMPSSIDHASSNDRPTEVSENQISESIYNSSKNYSKNTEHKYVNQEGQCPCKCAECIHTKMYMKGIKISVPVKVLGDTEQPPAANLESVPCGAVHAGRKCTCTESYGYAPCAQVQRYSRAQIPKRRSFFDWIKENYYDKVSSRQAGWKKPCQLYKINIEQAEEEGSPPRRLVFDMVDGIPKPVTETVATNTAQITAEVCAVKNQTCRPKYAYYSEDSWNCSTTDNRKNYKNEKNSKEKKKNCKFFPSNIHMAKRCQETSCFDSQGDTKVDFYYFDHGNAQYLHTTDAAPVLYCEVLAEKTEQTTTRFWAEIFTTMHIATSFIISFFLQLFKFLLYSILRPVMVGGIQLLSDYLVKPFLTTFFNGIIQPLMIFLYNIATSLRDLCDPLAEALGYFFKAIAHVFRAIRLVTVKKK